MRLEIDSMDIEGAKNKSGRYEMGTCHTWHNPVAYALMRALGGLGIGDPLKDTYVSVTKRFIHVAGPRGCVSQPIAVGSDLHKYIEAWYSFGNVGPAGFNVLEML